MLETIMKAVPHMARPDMNLDDWRFRDSAVLGLSARPPVPNSEDVERVAALPRRPQLNLRASSVMAQAVVELMNERLRRPDWQRTDCKCASFDRKCITSLQPAQAWALYEAPLCGGLYGLLATGAGKTAVGLLMPLVMPDCKMAVGLVPSNLVKQLVKEYLLWREHWKVPSLIYGPHKGYTVSGRPTLHVVSYAQLSQPTSTTLLRDLNPDFMFADEADKLADLDSARTKRFVRMYQEHSSPVRFCGWTGTPWDKSIMECAHLLKFALKKGSPLPLDQHTAKSWSLALDPSDRPAGRGALAVFCGPGETLHEGFHRRLVETPGVVATREGAIDIPLHLYERVPPPMPASVVDMIDGIRQGKRPDGEELVDALEVARVIGEAAQGFFYRWKFPQAERGPDGKLTPRAYQAILLWLDRRKEWRRELRVKLKDSVEHLDSEKLCTDAAERYYAGYQGELPVWQAECYRGWLEVKDAVTVDGCRIDMTHETEAIWVDDYLVDDAVDWANTHRGIVWYKHVTFGERVAKKGGFKLHGGGPGAEARILAEKGERSIVVSMDSHGRGRDGLQYLYNDQLIVTPPASGRNAEQLLARLHRVGQPQPFVRAEFYRHVQEVADALDKALDRAEFASTTWGAAQKLLTATKDWQ